MDDGPADGSLRAYHRDETTAERADRNYGEQLQELRVAQTAVQLLLGFQLTIAFTQPFQELSTSQKDLYLLGIGAGVAALLCLMAPVVVHRMLFGQGRKPQLVSATHVLTLLGMVGLAVAVAASVTLASWVAEGPVVARWFLAGTAGGAVLLWLALPLALRGSGARRAPSGNDSTDGP